MKEGIIYTGIPSKEELASCPGRPSSERIEKGPVACIECVQEIPCDPCEAACKRGAIKIGKQITSLPVLREDKCTGCGICVAMCPGLAITLLDKTYSDNEALVEFPFEYLPLPSVGDTVDAVNRAGEVVCKATTISIKKPEAFAGTAVVGIAIPKEFIDEVRSMKRLKRTER